MPELSPQKRAARDLLLREFERIGMRYQQHAEQQYESLRERQDLETLWRMAGLGDPPEFAPTVRYAAVAS